jgi:hypothetical protein
MPEQKYTFTPGSTNVMPAEMGSDAGLLGAAMVPRYLR